VLQWRDEMDSRFGLTFAVLDRDYAMAQRRERGFGVNPWTTHSRFILSHALLRDEAYAAPLRDWLDDVNPGPALLILDEAHNAAPARGSGYGVDSRFYKSGPPARAALRASTLPIGHTAQRPLQQLCVAAGDP
jgi:hypothetical protein